MLKMTFFDLVPYIQNRTGWQYYHGDCTYIELPDGKNMLVDISTKFGGSVITKKLLEMGVKSIDYFVVSHLHQDHTAGFPELAEHIEVKNILFSGYGIPNPDAELSVLSTAEKKDIPIKLVRMGDEMQFGEVNLKVLYPTGNEMEVVEHERPGLFLNWYSLVFKLTYGAFSALFTGDVHYETEEELVLIHGEQLQSTLLKIPHHGCDTSTGQLLVDTVKPQIAVVMSGDCEYVVQRKFTSWGIPLYTTYGDGTILVTTDGSDMQVQCDKGVRRLAIQEK